MAFFSRAIRAGYRAFGATRTVALNRGLVTASTSAVRRRWTKVGLLLSGATIAYGGLRLLGEEGWRILPQFSAAQYTSQPSVCGENKSNSVFIWIHLNPEANVKQCAKVAASLQSKVNQVVGPSPDDDDEMFAGVGFGCNFYKQATNGLGAPINYSYPYRKGQLGDMPSTGGDIFVHAKCNSYSKLYELTQAFLRSFPAGAIDKVVDIYGWTYQEGRDLSGFIDGTENPADEDDRQQVAVSSTCGGSYCVTQKWVHRFDVLQSTKDRQLENYIGRSKPDSIEQTHKSPSSHVARMVGGTAVGQKKPFEMVRHSQPYGTVTGESGLFFIGYAASPENIEYMLDRMVGADKDGLSDDVMRFTSCVAGTYWYFPSQEQLKRMC